MKQQPTRVQFGCGLCTPEGWLNLDSTPTLWLARLPLARSLAALALGLGAGARESPRVLMLNNLRYTRARYGDITRGLSLPSSSVRQLYASHVIEHLPLAATRQALRECHRLLAPDGLFRLVVPDLRHLVERYLEGADEAHDPEAAIRFCLESGLGSAGWGPLWSRLRGDRHHLMQTPPPWPFFCTRPVSPKCAMPAAATVASTSPPWKTQSAGATLRPSASSAGDEKFAFTSGALR